MTSQKSILIILPIRRRHHSGPEEQWLPYEADPAIAPVHVPLIAQGCRQTFSIMSRRDNGNERLSGESFYSASPRIYSNKSYSWVTCHRENGLCGLLRS